jgi:DNA invertase Pin-like site-specific DNA recombinase
MTKAFSYLRFSTPEQMRGDSFRRQTALAEAYAAQHGLELDTTLTFHDLGVSAFRGKNAETGRLAEFRTAVETGLVPGGSFLLVESLDRISRQTALKAITILNDIAELGVTVVTLNDGRQYSAETLHNDTTALLMAMLTFIRANEESATKAARLRAAWKGKRAKAAEKPLTSIAPAWLELDTTTGRFRPIPERAAVVARIFAMAAEGVGLQAIADRLNREGVPTFGARGREGQFWRRSYVHRIATSEAVVGTAIPHQIQYTGNRKARQAVGRVEGYFPTVVDRDLWQRVQAMRTGGTKAPVVRGGVGEVSNLLAGLARCPDCGSSMTRVTKGRSTKAGKPRLVCTAARGKGCTAESAVQEEAERALSDRAAQIIAEAPSGSEGLDASLSSAEGALLHQLGVVADLAEQYAATRSATIAAKLKEAEALLAEQKREVEELRQRIADTAGPVVQRRLAELLALLEAHPLDRTRANAALRAVVSRIVVDQRRGVLVLEWKHGGESEVLFAFPRRRAA